MYVFAVPISEYLGDAQLAHSPVEDKLILYRPLLQVAFVGNRAMADLARRSLEETPAYSASAPEALAFLRTIGFLQPDPTPPLVPDETYRPTTVVLLLTNRCNLRCTYCYANGGTGEPEMLSWEMARAAIDHASQCAAERKQPSFELTFHGGGEPVQAWEVLTQATAYARDKEVPCHVSMVSNGVWSANRRAWILDNLDGVSISFDGRAETQDRQRPFASGQGSFKAVMRSIGALDRRGRSYGIRMTATAPWQGRLPEDVRLICQETGCQMIQVEPAFNTRRGEHQMPTREQAVEFVDAFMAAFEIAAKAGRRLAYSGARPWLLTQTFCTAPYNALIVNPAGNLVACYEIANQSHTLARISSLGRIADGRVIVDWQARKALLTYLSRKRVACADCFCLWHCAGDCYTRSFESLDVSGAVPGPRCMINRAITARILLYYIMAGDGVWRGQGVHPQEAQWMHLF